MILLDENINDDQCSLLKQWKLKVRQVGVDVELKGVSDENIITALHELKGTLFFTRDGDFWDEDLCQATIVSFTLRLEEMR